MELAENLFIERIRLGMQATLFCGLRDEKNKVRGYTGKPVCQAPCRRWSPDSIENPNLLG